LLFVAIGVLVVVLFFFFLKRKRETDVGGGAWGSDVFFPVLFFLLGGEFLGNEKQNQPKQMG